MSRKLFLVSVVLVVAGFAATAYLSHRVEHAGTSSPDAISPDRDAFQVALITNGPLADSGYNQAQEEGLREMQNELGAKVFATALGSIPETGDAERVMRKLISRGADLVIASSFGYQDTTVKLAAEYPSVRFLQAWGFKPSTNLGTYSAKMYEAWYVMGVVAGRMTKTGRLGVVAAHPIPPMKWQVNAYALGAKSVNPSVSLSVSFINHWFDPGLASEAAHALVDQGADVLCGVLDNSVAVAQVAERRKVMLIGHNTDLAPFAPNAILVGTHWKWGALYRKAVEAMLNGNWSGTDGDTHGGFAEEFVGMTAFSERVPPGVRTEADSVIAKLRSGDLAVYSGPIRDNAGTTVVPAGQALTHEQIMGMDWMVEGVR